MQTRKQGNIIFLSFDDNFVRRWHESLPLLNELGRVTFYLTRIHEFKRDTWKQLKEISKAGHTIGCHTLNHTRAKEIMTSGLQKFLQEEITPWFDIMEAQGFDKEKLKHFAYPWGRGNGLTDKWLGEYFKTFRYGGREYIDKKNIREKRIFKAVDFGKHSRAKYSGWEATIINAININSGICIYMHKPLMHRLKWLLKLKKKGVEFLGMEDL